jgi:Transglycosylase SLT domain
MPLQVDKPVVVKSADVELLEVKQSNPVEKSARPERTKLTPPCGDRVVKWIWAAGFRGQEVRVAWAIAQRESNGNPNESTYPDLGLMQLNSPSWSGTKYWPADIYDPVQSLKAVKKMVRDYGWQPWGLRVKNGNISYDFSSYGMWSSWHHQNWIVIPFEKYYAQFPKKCAKNL